MMCLDGKIRGFSRQPLTKNPPGVHWINFRDLIGLLSYEVKICETGTDAVCSEYIFWYCISPGKTSLLQKRININSIFSVPEECWFG